MRAAVKRVEARERAAWGRVMDGWVGSWWARLNGESDLAGRSSLDGSILDELMDLSRWESGSRTSVLAELLGISELLVRPMMFPGFNGFIASVDVVVGDTDVDDMVAG